MIVENCETNEHSVTCYRLVIGGPSMWVENPMMSENAWTIYGNAAGLSEPVSMPLGGVVHHDAICVIDLLLYELAA